MFKNFRQHLITGVAQLCKGTRIALVFLSCCLLFSCSEGPVKKEEKDAYNIFKDDLGRTVKVKKNAHRFLPFAPSVTEILYLFCDSSEIVGRTQNCNYPPQAMNKPSVNNYPPDLEKILFLKPDLLITKDGMLSVPQADAIEKMGIPVYFQKYDSVRSIFRGVRILADLTGHGKKGRKVADSLERLLRKEERPVVSDKKVLMLISKDSYFCFGKNTYASDILHYCGGRNMVDSLFDNPYPMLTAEYILKVDPDVILGGPPVGLEKEFFELHPEMKRTKAYKNKQCYTVNDDYLSRPGPRVVGAILTIRKILANDPELTKK